MDGRGKFENQNPSVSDDVHIHCSLRHHGSEPRGLPVHESPEQSHNVQDHGPVIGMILRATAAEDRRQLEAIRLPRPQLGQGRPARFSIALAIAVQCCTPAGAQQAAPAAPCAMAFRAATLWTPGSESQHGVAMVTGTPTRPGTYYGHNYMQTGRILKWTAGPHSTAGELCAMTHQWIIQSKPGDGILRYGGCQTLTGVAVQGFKFVLVP